VALAGGAADGRIDALTVIMHELGHQIGLADVYSPGSESELMHGYLDPGERRLPDGVFETGAPTLAEGLAELGGIALPQQDISAV